MAPKPNFRKIVPVVAVRAVVPTRILDAGYLVPEARGGPTPPEEVVEQILFEFMYPSRNFGAVLSAEDIANFDRGVDHTRDVSWRKLLCVSRGINVMANCLSWRWICVDTVHELISRVTAAREGIPYTREKVGNWTWRMDVRLKTGQFLSQPLLQLIEHTPNLKVFVLDNTSTQYSPCMTDLITDKLGARCKHLIRVQFQSVPGEEPTVRGLKRMMGQLHELRTLHLDAVQCHPQGDDDNGTTLSAKHDFLETLSIGNVNRQLKSMAGIERASTFMRCALSPYMLPNLKVLHVQRVLESMIPFLRLYGARLEELGFCAGERRLFPTYGDHTFPVLRPHIMTYCPNVKRLVIVAGESVEPTMEWDDTVVDHERVENIRFLYTDPDQPSDWSGWVCDAILFTIERRTMPKLRNISIVANTLLGHLKDRRSVSGSIDRLASRGVEVATIEY